jgi:hypothetical protein
VTIEFNPVRCGFHGADQPPLVTKDILNTGVKPALLLECVREHFEKAGGVVMERAALDGIEVHPDGAWLDVSPAAGADTDRLDRPIDRPTGSRPPGLVTARLVVDCMGFGSP